MQRLHRGLAAITVCALGAAGVVAVPLAATAAESGIRINEAESSGGTPGDWVELYNDSATEIDLGGYIFRDNDDTRGYVIPAGTVVAPYGYLVLDELADSGAGHFDFGLGSGDSARLFDPSGALVDGQSWTAHGNPTWGVDAAGDWVQTAESTKGAVNVFPEPEQPADAAILINEVDSQPADWVEFYNPGAEALDVSGYEVRDNSDDHQWFFPAGSSIPAGGFLVVEESEVGLVLDATGGLVGGTFTSAIGVGGADRIRLFDATGALVDDTLPWSAHAALNGDAAAATLARCPDGEGAFVLAHPTPGASNSCVAPDVAINEIESNGDVTDWAEIINTGTSVIDLSGWTFMDNDPVGHAADTTPVAEGTLLEPGELFVFDQNVHFGFGLGNGDVATVRDAQGATVAEYSYAAHAAGVWGRCPDGTGDFVDLAVSTKGARNDCGNPVRINEAESNDGDPGDWVELVNPTAATVDVSGIVVKDDDDTHAYTIPSGTTIAAGGYLVIEGADLGFGLGGGDSVRLFDGETPIDTTTWPSGHAAVTWGRCPDATGEFAVTATSTKGAANLCAGEIVVSAWPGSAEVTVLDETPTFLSDSSGLDAQETAEGTFLWAVDNGTGRFWKLEASADGSVAFADGWEAGKRVRYQKDAANSAAAGPDTEGITVDGDGFVYLAAERDNSAKAVNQSMVLKVDPDATGSDLVALEEWDLTALLPSVGANLGAEAVEWVSDDILAGQLWDTAANAVYDPAAYPGHGEGLFFVAVEDNGGVYAFALNTDGSATLVSEIDPGLSGVMGLDYDSALGVLWAVCDDGCEGTSAQVELNGTDTPGVAHFARPAGMPNINNEGFATAPASLSVDGDRPVWWFADGFDAGALRVGTLPGGETTDPTDPTDPSESPVTPLPGDGLTGDNDGEVTATPNTVVAGGKITVVVGDEHAGTGVEVWLYSTPTQIATGTLDAQGAITVTIPASTEPGTHRVAVYAEDGSLLGWTTVEVTAAADGSLAVTGGTGAGIAAIIAVVLMAVGAAVLIVRRRMRTA